MKIKKKLVLFIALLVLLVYIISPYNPMHSTAYADNNNASTIGGVEVNGLSKEELKIALAEAIASWTAEPLQVTGGGATLELDAAKLQYDIDATIAYYETSTAKPWYAFWQSENVVHLPINIVPNEEIRKNIDTISIWDTEQTYNSILVQASYLKEHTVEAVMSTTAGLQEERIALAIEQIPQGVAGIKEIVALLDERVITPGEEISLLTEIEPIYGALNRLTINYVASMLYSVALSSGSQITERHSQNVVPAYLEPGIEATVHVAQNQDLRFVNTLSDMMKLKVTEERGQLKMEVYSTSTDSSATVKVKHDETVDPRIITRYSYDLAIGHQRIEQQGKQGLRVSVYRTFQATGEEQLVSRDFYKPVNRIVIKSSRQPAETAPSTEVTPIDLDGDGLPDANDTPTTESPSSSDNKQPTGNPSQPTDKNVELDEKGNVILPEGSYYDKAGNLIQK